MQKHTKICYRCKTEKPYTEFFKDKYKKDGHRSACKKCLYESLSHPKEKDCQFCGKKFKPYTTVDKFCSLKCRVDNQKSKRTINWTPEQTSKRIGKNNPAYRNGNYARGTTRTNKNERVFIKNGKELKQKMIDARGFVYCESCGRSDKGRYETHHLIFRSEKPLHEHLHDKKNLLVVCVQCHNDFHKNKGKRNDIVATRQLDQLFGKDVLWK